MLCDVSRLKNDKIFLEDLKTNDESSTNQTLWLLAIIAIVAIPVALAIRRILRSTPK